MKNISTSFFLLFVSTLSIGQSLFEEGLELNYSLSFFSDPWIEINTAKVKGDTLIAGITCQILEFDHSTCDLRPNLNFINTQGDSILYYNQELNEFKLLYDFSAGVGDTIKIDFWEPEFTMDSTFYVFVQSIDSILIGAQYYKQMHVIYDSGNNSEIDFDNPFRSAVWIEEIGSTINFFHYIGLGLCDNQYNNCLKSIKHPNFGQLTINDCLSATEEISDKLNAQIKIWPNPCADQISIKLAVKLSTQKWRAEIVDIEGRKVSKQTITFYSEDIISLDVKDLKPSIYILLMFNERGEIISRSTFVKNDF